MERTPTEGPVHVRRVPHRRRRLQRRRPRPGTPVGTSHCARPDAMTSRSGSQNEGGGDASIDLYWLPLGAGDPRRCVRGNGLVYEALVAARQRPTSSRPLPLSADRPARRSLARDRDGARVGRAHPRLWGGRRRVSRNAVLGPRPSLPLRDPLLARRRHSRPGCCHRQPPPGQQRHGQGAAGARPGRALPHRHLGPRRTTNRGDVELQLPDRLVASPKWPRHRRSSTTNGRPPPGGQRGSPSPAATPSPSSVTSLKSPQAGAPEGRTATDLSGCKQVRQWVADFA